MKQSFLTYVISSVIAAIDTGKYQDISIAEVEDHIERGDVFPWLEGRLGDDIDLGLLHPRDEKDEDRVRELTADLADILAVHAGHERQKWGIEKSGLCLLAAWTNELVQRREIERQAIGSL